MEKLIKNIFTVTLFLTITLLILLSTSIVLAYELHEPILIENIHTTAENPYIIEGYEAINPKLEKIKIPL